MALLIGNDYLFAFINFDSDNSTHFFHRESENWCSFMNTLVFIDLVVPLNDKSPQAMQCEKAMQKELQACKSTVTWSQIFLQVNTQLILDLDLQLNSQQQMIQFNTKQE